MSSLQELINQEKAAEGVQKLIVMFQIRQYLQAQSHQSILEEISKIWENEDLKILVGAGMRGELWYAVIAQGARLRGIV